MAKFIEVHVGRRDQDSNLVGMPVLVNLEAVQEIVNNVHSCSIYMRDSYEMKVLDKYEDLRMMVGSACGGIPVGRGSR